MYNPVVYMYYPCNSVKDDYVQQFRLDLADNVETNVGRIIKFIYKSSKQYQRKVTHCHLKVSM